MTGRIQTELSRLLAPNTSSAARPADRRADVADVRHEQHYQELQKTLGASRDHAVANHQGKEVRAKDAEHTANGSADQALQADQAQPPFEKNDGHADRPAHARVQLCDGSPKGSIR